MHVVDMIFFWARTEPHRAAVIQPEMVTTYQGLADAIESISERIDRLQLDVSEPIAVSIANPSFFLAAAFALLRCGFTVAPVNRPHFMHLRAAGIRNLIYDTEGQIMSGGRNIRFDMSWLPAAGAARKPYTNRPAGNGDMMFFTSGTTGLPKIFRRSMSGLSERFGSPLTCANGDHARTLVLPGLAGGFGFNRACEMLYVGKTACFAAHSEAALALIDLFRIEVIVASPHQALSLAEIQANTGRYDTSSIKMVRLGGALVSADVALKIKTNLCRNIILMYSSTEAGITATASYDSIANIPDAVGFLTPGTEVEVVDDTGTVLPAGAQGYIKLRTTQFVSNFDAPADRAGPQKVWFNPGDVGRVTEDQVLCIAGRRHDMINRGGAKISAVKIEEIVDALPAIKESAACGVQGTTGLEEIWVAVVAQAPIDVAAIKEYLRNHDAIGTVVDEVIEVPQLPRTALGKVQKNAVKDMLLGLKTRG